jgi:hypothetical protein
MDVRELAENIKDIMKSTINLSESSDDEEKDLKEVVQEADADVVKFEVSADNIDDVIDREPRGNDFNRPLTEEEISQIVRQDIENAKQYQAQFSQKFTEAYKAYHAIIDEIYNAPNRSHFVSSDVMDTIEWIMPSLMRIFMGSNDVVLVKPIEAKDAENAEIHQQLLNYQFTCRMDGFTKLYTWFKDSLIYGTGVVKISWENFYDKVSFRYEELSEEEFMELVNHPNISIEGYDEYTYTEVELDPETGEEVVKSYNAYKNVKGYVKKLVYSGPWIENIPISSFYIEAGARSIQEANFVAHRVRRSMDYLRRMQREGIYHNVDKIIPKAEGDDDYEHTKYADIETESEKIDVDSFVQETSGRERVWVWECWVKLDIDGDGLLENLLITMVDDVILRIEENPFDHGEPPFEILVPIIDTHKFYGISLTSLILEFQKLKTALFRNIFDNIAFAVNGWYLVSRHANVDLNALQNVGPGDIVLTDDIANFRRIEPSGVPNYLVTLAEFIEEMKQQRTGLPRIAQGLSPNSLSSSATAITAQMNAGQQRIELIARIMAETGCKRLFRKMISLNQQFIDQEFVIRVFDKELRITPDKLDGTFDLIVNVGVGGGARELQQQQMIQLLNLMPTLAQFGLVKPVHVYNIVSKLLESMGYKDVDKFIENPATAMANQPMSPQGQPQTPTFGRAVNKAVKPQPNDIRSILQNTPKSNPFT